MDHDVIPAFLVYDDPDHIPLALGMIVAYCRQYGDGQLGRRYRFLPTTDLSIDEVKKIGQAFGPGVWLFSNYAWTTERCLEISREIKAIDERNITIHGGPNAPKYEEVCARFLNEHRHVDFLVRGEGEITAAELLTHVAENWKSGDVWNGGLEEIAGISFIRPDQPGTQVVRTVDRARLLDLDCLPSPYLTGVFDRGFIKKPRGDAPHNIAGVTIETNRGCPYKCTFCDWGSLTNQKIAHFSLERIEAEFEWVARNQVPVVIFADANFGIFKRDIEIARIVARTKEKYGYPREILVSYAKNDSKKRTEIVKILLDAGLSSQGVVSIQTRDPKALEAVQRTNIKSDHYDTLAQLFRNEKLPLAIELMIGLPGSTVQSLKNDLQYYYDSNVLVRAHATRLLMNSPMADPAYIAEYEIETEEALGRVISSSSFTREDYNVMLKIYAFYRLLIRYSVLTYVMRYLQWECGVSASEFLHQAVSDAPHSLPSISAAIYAIGDSKYPFRMVSHMYAHTDEVYHELIKYVRKRYRIPANDSAFEAVLTANQAVIPSAANEYPLEVHLEHDFPAYFSAALENGGKPVKKLMEYGGCRFEVKDAYDICATIEAGKHLRFNPYQIFFELSSNLVASQGEPHWVKLKRPHY